VEEQQQQQPVKVSEPDSLFKEHQPIDDQDSAVEGQQKQQPVSDPDSPAEEQQKQPVSDPGQTE